MDAFRGPSLVFVDSYSMRLRLITTRTAALLTLALMAAPALAQQSGSLSQARTVEPTWHATPTHIAKAPPLTYRSPASTPTAQIAQAPVRFNTAPMEKPWHADIWYGALNPGDFTESIIDPASTTIEDEQIVGFTVGRKLFDLGYGFSFGLGVLGAHRIDEGGFELDMPMTVTFDGFPWRERLPTKLAISVGPSFISEITPTEKRKDDDNQGSKFLNMFSPEIEFGVPDTDWSGFFRLHHRSGIFGLIDGVSGGSTYFTFGVRHRFGLGDELPWK